MKKPLCVLLALVCRGSAPILAGVPSIGEPELLADIRPGAAASHPQNFVRAGGLGFFVAGPTVAGGEVWRTDGTAPGTFRVSPDTVAVSDFLLSGAGRLAYFLEADEETLDLWRSDGTVPGTFALTSGLRVASVQNAPGAQLFPTAAFVPETGLLFFSAGAEQSIRYDYELWVTDGTVEGTRQVEDLNLQGSSYPGSMIALGGRAFFLRGDELGRNRELWTSDGTLEGTFRVKDLQEGDDRIRHLRRVGDRLVLLAETAAGLAVWRSDGTAAGTVLAVDLPALYAFSLDSAVAAGRHLFFSVSIDALSSSELWVTDGTAAGTARVLEGVTEDRNLYWELYQHPVGDGLFFKVSDPEHGQEPWWSDGTRAGTRRIADLCPGPCDSFPELGGTHGERAFFSATNGASGHEPWLTDGTAAGTRMLGDLCPGSCSSHPFAGHEAEGLLFFAATNTPQGQEIWLSDGTAAGTRAATDFVPEIIFPLGLFEGTAIPGGLVFGANDGVHGAEPWAVSVGGDPQPPAGEWLTSARVPGFRFKVRIGGATIGRQESDCIPETLCVSGALPGRSEVFLRIVGPRPNGYLWPTIVRFTTSTVEVWVEQQKTGIVRYYRLEAPPRDSAELNGLVDKQGFRP